MVVEKTKLFCASKVAKSLLSHNNMLGPKTVEPTRQFFDCEVNVRASGDADKQQACHQLMVGKRRRSVTRLGAVIICEVNSRRHGGILRLAILKVEPVLKFSDVGALKQVNRAIRAKVNIRHYRSENY